MTFLTYAVTFKTILGRTFVAILNIAGLHQSPPPSDFDGLPFHRVRWNPKLFVKMTANDVNRLFS